ncbi:MAG: MipA/OmpV family protein [Hyphomonas sp.]
MRSILITAAFASLTLASHAQAENDESGWQFTLGAGSLYSPSYEGDDDYDLKILPNIQVKYGDRFFASVQEGLGYNAFRSDGWSAGPIGRIKFSRKEDGDQTFTVSGSKTDDLIGLGDIGTSLELGGFLRYRNGPFSAGAELRQAVTGHEGLVFDLNANVSGRIATFGPPVFWSLGPRIKLVDDTFNGAYFGVTAAQAAASGLPEYTAGGGVQSYGVGAFAFLPLDRAARWSLVAFSGYDRLAGDAGNAPLVQLRGDADQFSTGIFLSYTFGQSRN